MECRLPPPIIAMPDTTSIYLAVDLGAGSGRVIAGLVNQEKLTLEEINRFENVPFEKDAGLFWDFEVLWKGVLEGLKKAVHRFGLAKIQSVGVDAWGVDYGFIGPGGELLAGPRHYRDQRTKGVMDNLCSRIPAETIFEKSGIQFIDINTLVQMGAEVQDPDSVLPQADQFLLIPDLINLRLTGVAKCERTNASTTQLYNPAKKDWSRALFDALGLSLSVAPDLIDPGQFLAPILPAIAEQTGLSPHTKVVTVGSHDTASAVAAVPAEPGTNFAYLSSGTWSLLGVEINEPILTPLVREYNFTNEVGVFETIRLLKNINGLWLVQECRRVWKDEGNDWSYFDLAKMGAGAVRLQSFIDPDDERFSRRCDMPLAIMDYCRETGQDVPSNPGQIMRLVVDSLALKVRFVLDRLERVIGHRIDVLHIIGGGGQNERLNQSIASSISRPVIVGPYEATAAGNLVMQKVACGRLSTLEEARGLVRRSFQTKTYLPAHPAEWELAYERFRNLIA